MEFGIVGAPEGVREGRIWLTPRTAGDLILQGATVRVETKAGATAGFSDEDFAGVGCEVVYRRSEVLGRSDVLLTVAPPQADELELLADGSAVIGLVPEQSRAPLFEASNEAGVRIFDLAHARDAAGRRPVRERMAEVAGSLCVPLAARLLESPPSLGVLLGGVAGVAPAAVVVLGTGTLGTAAARAFSGAGAQVAVVGSDLDQLRAIDRMDLKHVITLHASAKILGQVAAWADVLVGAASRDAAPPPKLVAPSQGKRGAVWIDLAVTDGGCIEGSRPVYGPEEAYEMDGVICCPIPNLPSRVARTASRIMASTLLPILRRLQAAGTVDPAAEPLLDNGLLRGGTP